MNNKDLTLVILAAGLGSRFGGLKQITPLGPNQEFIIDYSIYDAIKAGFTKIVFLIKEENYHIFQEKIGKKIARYVKVVYAFQNNDDFIDKYPELKQRKKPLGTAHALWCCKEVINEPFAMINADDFYGRDAFLQAAQFLRSLKENTPNYYGMIAYLAPNTLTTNGAVKRGVCEVLDDNLVGLTESSVELKNNQMMASPLDGSAPFNLNKNSLVSMNFLLFTPSIFSFIERKLFIFLDEQQDLITTEFLLPDVLFEAVREKFATVKVLKTTATWYGVTYKEDSITVQNAIETLIEEGTYPQNLWQ